MRILLDDRDCSLEADSIGAAVAAVADLAEQAGRRVVDVTVDGEAWSADDLASPERLAGGADEVRLTSVRPADLVRETFQNAAEALVEAEQAQRRAAQLLQGDHAQEGLDELSAAVGIWTDIQEAVRGALDFLEVDIDRIDDTCPGFRAALADLNARLTTLRDAMQSGDAVGLCDCLLYDFPPTTGRWAELLAQLARGCEDLPTAPSP